jgi:hypothetical protein
MVLNGLTTGDKQEVPPVKHELRVPYSSGVLSDEDDMLPFLLKSLTVLGHDDTHTSRGRGRVVQTQLWPPSRLIFTIDLSGAGFYVRRICVSISVAPWLTVTVVCYTLLQPLKEQPGSFHRNAGTFFLLRGDRCLVPALMSAEGLDAEL